MSAGSLIGGAAGAVVGFFIGGPIGAMYGAAIGFGIGMAIDPMQPDMPSPGKPEIGKFQVTTADEGVPVGDLLGTTKLTGNIFWYANNRVEEVKEEQEPAGKGGPEKQTVTTGYKYYLTWAMGLCTGPIDALYTVYQSDKVVWAGELERPASGGQETITLYEMGSMTLFFGTADQVAPAAMTNLLADSTLSPAYRHLAYAFFNDCYIGDYNRAPMMKFVVRKTPADSEDSPLNVIESYQYNPAHAIHYVLTSMIGLSEQYIDLQSFREAAYQLFYEGRGVCILFKQQSEALRYIETILFHIDGVLRWGVNGKLHLKLMRQETNPSTLPLVNQDVVLDDPSIDRKGWLDTLNEIKVQYPKLIMREFATCEEPTPSVALDSCPGINNGVFHVAGGCLPLTIQTSLYRAGQWEQWTYQRTVWSRRFNYLCTQYVCTAGPDTLRKMRVVDDKGRASNEIEINITHRPTLNWAGNKQIEPGGSVLVGVSGGKPPYRFSVSALGWWFDSDYTKKELVSYEPNVTLYHDFSCCDDADVLVKDDCLQSVSGSVELLPDPSLAFTGDTPETIPPGGEIEVFITGGVPPFSWTAPATGYTFRYPSSSERSNTLISSTGTCGVDYDPYIEIEVVDLCGAKATHVIRNTGGQWGSTTVIFGNCVPYGPLCTGEPVGQHRYTIEGIGTYQSCLTGYCKDVIDNAEAWGFCTTPGCTPCGVMCGSAHGLGPPFDDYCYSGSGQAIEIWCMYRETWEC